MEAARRGVRVDVVLDQSREGERYTSATYLLNNGLVPLTDDRHAIAHNKVMVIDGRVVLTGSFNFTKAAEEKNAENLIVVEDAALAKRYADNWAEHAAHSRAYERFAERGRR